MSEELPTPLYHLDSDQVYEPREDTFLLLDALERDLPALRSARLSLVLEIGPGSGVVVTAIAKALVGTACLAVDINPFACTTTKKTSATNGTHVEVVNGDLLNAVVARNAIDLLIFNPPYVPSDPEDETQLIDKAWAGSELGRSTTDRLFPVLPELMSFACVGYLVVIEENQPDQMADQLSLKGFDCSFVAHRNVRGERLRILRFSRGLAEELRQLN